MAERRPLIEARAVGHRLRSGARTQGFVQPTPQIDLERQELRVVDAVDRLLRIHRQIEEFLEIPNAVVLDVLEAPVRRAKVLGVIG